jgi:hypothetical protein
MNSFYRMRENSRNPFLNIRSICQKKHIEIVKINVIECSNYLACSGLRVSLPHLFTQPDKPFLVMFEICLRASAY